MIAIPASISDKLLGYILDYIRKGGENIANDISTNRAIKKAIETSAERFANEYDNKDLAKVLATDTKFYDLVSVQQAIHDVLVHPFDHAPQTKIENEFEMVLPDKQRNLASHAAQFYLEILREQLIGIEKLNDKLKLIYLKRTADATERTANGVEKLVSIHDRLSDLDEAKKTYLKYIVDTNQYIDPRGIMQTRRSVALKLDDVYITLRVQREATSTRTDAIYQQNLDGQAPSNAIKDSKDGEVSVSAQLRGETIELSKALRDNKRLVFLGDPGAGKTTLMRFLALQFAKSCLIDDSEVIDRDRNGYGLTRLPIFVRISQYASLYLTNSNISIRDFVLGNYGEVDVDGDTLRALFEQYINLGKALVMLDGLDEIVDSNDRSEISRRIENFVSSCNAENLFLVTSRIAGYRSAALTSSFSHFVLCDLERPQIEKFLRNWCPAVERALLPDTSEAQRILNADAEVEDILDSVDENAGVRRLASNPLMLTILALIHRNGARLPSRRVELYQLAVKTLLEDWELARGLSAANIVRESEALRMLGPLAFWMHENKPNGLATEWEVKEKLVNELATTRGLAIENPEIQDAVDDFLRRVREHTGLFVEKAPKQYGFMHLTFEEYFAARDLVKRRGQATQNIYGHRHNSRWEEVLLLAIAFESNDHPADAQDYIKTSILAWGEDANCLGFKSSDYESLLHRDLVLAIRVIGDCVGIEPIFIQTVMKHLGEIWKQPASRQILRDKLAGVLSALKGSEMLSGFVPSLLAFAKDQNKHLRGNSIWALGLLGYLSEDVTDVLLNALNDDALDVCNLSIEALGKLECCSDRAVDALIHTLQESEPSRTVAHALGRLCNSNQAVLCKVLTALKDMGDEACSKVIPAIGLYGKGNKLVVDEIVIALQSSDVFIRKYALRAIINFIESNTSFIESNTPLIEVLLSVLKDKDADVRAEGVKTLGKIASKDAKIVNAIIDATKDDVSLVRVAAINVLGDLNEPSKDIVEAILFAIKDVRSNVRSAAAKTLGRLQDKSDQVVSELLIAMKDGDETVAWNSVGALGKLSFLNDDMKNRIIKGLMSLDIDVCDKTVESLANFSEIPEALRDALLNLFASTLRVGNATIISAGSLFVKANKDKDRSHLFEELKKRNHLFSVFTFLDLAVSEDESVSGINLQVFLNELSDQDGAVRVLTALGLAALTNDANIRLDRTVYPTLSEILVGELENLREQNTICKAFDVSRSDYIDGLYMALSNIYS